jgi:tetraacyldisaccharide 4'-kinase
MIILSPLGWLYRGVAEIRNAMYDRGVIESHPLGARTISVGNITTGGTGKTPLVVLSAEILADRGEKVCVLTRGYGRDDPKNRVLVSNGAELLANAKTGGDEPVEMARLLLGKAIVVADADRVAASKWARENFGVTAFVLDDGFQHRRAKRDVDIVCIDATDPFGNGRVLPAGKLREPLNNLSRASAFVLSRSDLAGNIESIKTAIRKYNLKAPIFEAEARIAGSVHLDEFLAGSINPDGETVLGKLYAFCGLGNPEGFFDSLRRAGVELAGVHKFRDHHEYDQEDIETIESEANWAGAAGLVTTAKDAVKLAGLKFKLPCFVAIAETVISDREAFADLLVSSPEHQ